MDTKQNQGSIAIITTHPFWREPLGCGFLMRSRYKIFRAIYSKVFVIFITSGELSCPLAGLTLRVVSRPTEQEAKEINRFLKEHKIDTCYFSYSSLYFITPFLSARSFVETHDVLHLREKEFNDFGYTPPISISKHNELERLKFFMGVVTINPEESIYLRSLGLNNVATVPPYIEFKPWRRSKRKSVGFIGSRALPNVHGILSLKKFLNQCPSVYVAGPISLMSEVIEEIPSHVVKLGILNNLSDFYSKVDVCLAPIFFGAGMKIKVLEALANNKPQVVTRHAVSAFPAGIEQVTVIVDDTVVWTESTVEQAFEIANSTIFDYYREFFTLPVIQSKFEGLFRSFD